MKEDRGQWEEIICSKIYDYEVESNTEDWDAISAKLSGGKTVRFISYRKIYLAVAATVAAIALLITGGLFLFSNKDYTQDTQLVEVSPPQTVNKERVSAETQAENIVEKTVDNLLAHAGMSEKKTVEPGLEKPDEPQGTPEAPTDEINVLLPDESKTAQIQENEIDDKQDNDVDLDHLKKNIPEETTLETPYIADATPEIKRRRWGFGVGTGGISAGSTSTNSGVMASSRLLRPDEYMYDNHTVSLRSLPQTATLIDPIDGIDFPSDDTAGKVKHKIPVSGGFGVSYYLSDRWALQSGAVYTLLRSKGSYYDGAGNLASWKQNLHFVGVPLSVSYTIADWQRIRFYVSAGGMGEWNVAGKINRTAEVENLEILGSQKLRMTKPLWSVNSRAGAVYPLWKFVNLYAEAGAAYYFDNKSSIETIRSDKPFNVSLQAGIRLGF